MTPFRDRMRLPSAIDSRAGEGCASGDGCGLSVVFQPKCVTAPVDARRAGGVRLDTHDVEATGVVPVGIVRGEELCGCRGEFRTLSAVHRFHGGSEGCSRTIPDLDEHETAAVQHDQVDLTAPRPEVAVDAPETVPAEMIERQFFG